LCFLQTPRNIDLFACAISEEEAWGTLAAGTVAAELHAAVIVVFWVVLAQAVAGLVVVLAARTDVALGIHEAALDVDDLGAGSGD
jgi:hypothetical protein